MTDHVETFKTASVQADIETLMTTLADDAALVSPLVGGSRFRGRADLEMLLRAVYTNLSDLRWTEHYRDGNVHTVMGECRVGRVQLTDAMILHTDDDGRIEVIRPHLRPWKGLTAFAVRLGPTLVRNPGLVRRSLRP